MKDLAQHICDILHDYHNYNGFVFTPERVIKWVNQFDEPDRQFILEEFLHLLKQGIYISEGKAKEKLLDRLEEIAAHFKIKLADFLKNCEFLLMQERDKSQYVLLKLLNTALKEKHGFGIRACGSVSKKYVIYLDDVIATGGTVYADCKKWMEIKDESGETNLAKALKKQKILIVNVFCIQDNAKNRITQFSCKNIPHLFL